MLEVAAATFKASTMAAPSAAMDIDVGCHGDAAATNSVLAVNGMANRGWRHGGGQRSVWKGLLGLGPSSPLLLYLVFSTLVSLLSSLCKAKTNWDLCFFFFFLLIKQRCFGDGLLEKNKIGQLLELVRFSRFNDFRSVPSGSIPVF